MGKETENKNETLDNFEGFENASEIDFFGSKETEAVETEEVITEITEDKSKPTTEVVETKKEEKKKEEPEIAFFEEDLDNEEEEEVITNSDEEEEVITEQLSSKAMLTKLKEKGLVDFELEEDQELTDELADELLEDSYDDAIEKSVEEKFKSLPDNVKNIVKYAMNGGNVDSLLNKMKSQTNVQITKDMDLENEENQIAVIKAEKEGEDSETTEAYIEFLKESGKLKGVSEKIHGKLVEKQKEISKAEATRQAQIKAESKKNERLFKKELTDFVNEADNLNGLPLSKKDKSILPNYMSEKITLEDGRVTTQMHNDLYNALQDKEKAVLLAKLLQSEFDFSSIAKAEKTKYTKEVKGDLTRSKKTTPQKTVKKKSLADYFND